MSIEDDISFLERVPTLNLLGRQALRILAIGAQSRHVPTGQVLFSAGEDADGGCVVREGRFKLAPPGSAGKAVVVGPFTLLGEVALLAPSRRPVTATALEPSSALLIPRPLFRKMLDSFPETARKLRDTLVAQLTSSTREMHKVRAILDAYERK
jgi:CRP-like cAMP-binding protein